MVNALREGETEFNWNGMLCGSLCVKGRKTREKGWKSGLGGCGAQSLCKTQNSKLRLSSHYKYTKIMRVYTRDGSG